MTGEGLSAVECVGTSSSPMTEEEQGARRKAVGEPTKERRKGHKEILIP
jgi:hypothetical protein